MDSRDFGQVDREPELTARENPHAWQRELTVFAGGRL